MRVVTLLVLCLWTGAAADAAEGLPAAASTSGPGMMVVGPDPTNFGSARPITGSINITSLDMGNRWSHVQNTDRMEVMAEISSEGGGSYTVNISTAMPRHPKGKYTTWFGAVYWHEMHGDTGIGSSSLPKVKPEIALWGWAEVRREGQLVASMVPAHVMVMTEAPMPGIMLEVATEEKNLPAVPDGYISVMWPTIASIQMPTRQVYGRQIAGWAALIGVVLLFGALTYWEPRRADTRNT